MAGVGRGEGGGLDRWPWSSSSPNTRELTCKILEAHLQHLWTGGMDSTLPKPHNTLLKPKRTTS